MSESMNLDNIKPGTLLVSEPYLSDENFRRTVILICEHSNSHSFGLVLNQPQGNILETSIENELSLELPLFLGGPVDPTVMQFVHKRPDIIPNGVALGSGLYWAGDFEIAIRSIVNKEIEVGQIKFFIGYSGWGAGQLSREIRQNSWILGNVNREYLFETEPNKLWRKVLYDKGGDYRLLSNYPLDPSLN